MKTINHRQGNYTFVCQGDSNVMYGTIKMSLDEFTDFIFWLEDEYKKTKRTSDTYTRDALSHVFNYVLVQFAKRKKENPDRVSLGVKATEMLFHHYNLPRYKRQNYVIEIKN